MRPRTAKLLFVFSLVITAAVIVMLYKASL
jgi:hypothetical protein